ncbi:MAG: OmpH family outer membrane protein [Lewinella sp.]|nr:OmpH family outer membrane protein [Lewinella sp.]
MATFLLASLLLTACTKADNPNKSSSTGNNPAAAEGTPSIVFIQSDSLQTGYTVLAQELARLEENFTKAQENLSREGNALQREANALQNKAQQGLLSPNQIQAEQQKLARKEQEVMQRRDIALGSIQQEQQALQERFVSEVKEILEEIRLEKATILSLTKALVAASSQLTLSLTLPPSY